MARVYIETTIPSFYFETRSAAQSVLWRSVTRRWWDERRSDYELVLSEAVVDELRRAPARKATRMLELVDGLPRLDLTDAALDAAAYYIEHRLVPHDALADALHIALCAVHGVDFLLTWNCRHLANANKTRHLQILNARLDIPTPIITTPYSLLGEMP